MDKFANPSELSTAVEPLRKLLDAIKGGEGQKFVVVKLKFGVRRHGAMPGRKGRIRKLCILRAARVLTVRAP